MKEIVDAGWRAALACLHPRVILWSLLPLLLSGAVVAGLGWLYWEPAVAAVRRFIEQWSLVAALLQWLESVGGGGLRALIAPIIVIALAVPAIVVLNLLLVAWLMTPAMVDFVAARRFPALQRRGAPGAWWLGLAHSLGCTVLAIAALALSLPLWLVPPLALLVPPLVWGWLAARVLGFDVLSGHATAAERQRLQQGLRWPLLAMGLVCGLLGAVPSLVWALGAVALVLAPLVIVLSMWLYTLVFAYASLWFAHFTLSRLAQLRADAARPVTPAPAQALGGAGATLPPPTLEAPSS
jgi:hypothetical protein